MVKRKAAVADGQASLKKRKAGRAEQLVGGSSGPAVLAPLLLKGSQDAAKASGSMRGKGPAQRPGKAKRSRAAAPDAAETPLPEPSEGAAAQPLEREDASGAAATAVGLLENGKAAAAEAAFRNKEKVLLLSSRGITHRYRHLLLDLAQLLPHSKKDSKLDTKSDRGVLNEVADMKGCSSVLFFEARKKKDLYVWLAKAPEGPSVKFYVTNVHTMAELKLSGNHLKGSRPVLSFHKAFDEQPHLQLLKEMLTQAFATPRRHHKSKPFCDHVLAFSVADSRIWLRNYQVVPAAEKKDVAAAEGAALVEVGPRACLMPIRIFAGSFGGPVLYENPAYVSPNKVRAALKRARAGKYGARVQARSQRREHVAKHQAPRDELADVFQ